jgi:hypothetical protein
LPNKNFLQVALVANAGKSVSTQRLGMSVIVLTIKPGTLIRFAAQTAFITRLSKALPMIFRIASIAMLLIILSTRAAYSWGGPEHQKIGDFSLKKACAEYNHSKSIRDVCERFGANNKESVYGSLNKFFGDHISKPENVMGEGMLVGLRECNDNILYALAALDNGSHFYPMTFKKWREYHEKAMDVAARSRNAPNAESRNRMVDSAIILNAFADHFLEDSYSTGHMGQNRRMTSHVNSLMFHNYYNTVGRTLIYSDTANPDDAPIKKDAFIRGFGDGSLDFGPSCGHRFSGFLRDGKWNRDEDAKNQKVYHDFVLGNVSKSLHQVFASIDGEAATDGYGKDPVEIKGFQNPDKQPFDNRMIPAPVATKYDIKAGKRFITRFTADEQYVEAWNIDLNLGVPATHPMYLKVSYLGWLDQSWLWSKRNQGVDGFVPTFGIGYDFVNTRLPISSSLELEYLFPFFYDQMNDDPKKPWFFANGNINWEILDFVMIKTPFGIGFTNPVTYGKTQFSNYYFTYGISISFPIVSRAAWLPNPFYSNARIQD